jgi:hypothetical protein
VPNPLSRCTPGLTYQWPAEATCACCLAPPAVTALGCPMHLLFSLLCFPLTRVKIEQLPSPLNSPVSGIPVASLAKPVSLWLRLTHEHFHGLVLEPETDRRWPEPRFHCRINPTLVRVTPECMVPCLSGSNPPSPPPCP